MLAATVLIIIASFSMANAQPLPSTETVVADAVPMAEILFTFKCHREAPLGDEADVTSTGFTEAIHSVFPQYYIDNHLYPLYQLVRPDAITVTAVDVAEGVANINVTFVLRGVSYDDLRYALSQTYYPYPETADNLFSAGHQYHHVCPHGRWISQVLSASDHKYKNPTPSVEFCLTCLAVVGFIAMFAVGLFRP